ncbi:hypothetical protein GALL_419010 [mine drainage metagenome]|uniref:Uncharacterized protein n=1 Tax=mine drainage metagenome TaxID=410659 RepID=A0A1J5PZK8_9ZZZZ
MQQVDLAWRIVDMVVATDDMGDAHIPVVHHHTEIVGRRAVGTGDDEVIQLLVGNGNAPFHLVNPGHDAGGRVAESHHRRHTRRRRRQYFAFFRPPSAVVARLEPCRHLRLAHCSQLLGRCIAMVGRSGRQHPLNHRLVAVHALHLVKRAFVVIQTQPAHAIQNRLHGLWCGTCHIGILDAQNEFSAMLAGVSPGEQRGTSAADMQKTSRAGSETGTDGHGGSVFNERRGFYHARPFRSLI